jgi:signal transduction histidine kinase
VTIGQQPHSDMNRRELLDHYERIIEISQELNSTFDLMELLRKIVSAAKELINGEASSIILVDDASGKLRFMIASNIKPHEMENIVVPMEGSIAGWIVTHGEPRVINNIDSEPQHFEGVDKEIRFHTRNILGVPMRNHDKVIGVLQVVNKLDNQRFNDDDIVTARTLASQAGLAIENARLFQQSDFVSEMVHELRTPLLALRASTTLLQRDDLPQEKRSDIVVGMRSETDRLIEMTSEFLDVARLESGRESLKSHRFKLTDLLQECADVVKPLAQNKNISIHVVSADTYHAVADRGKIKQVTLNLLTNAIKYNRENGEIFLEINTMTEEEYEHPFLRISVRDTGYGISQEHQKNMFQKFYRVPALSDVASGTGLGLAICKHIIEAHGGNIRLESKLDVGSNFMFTIPQSDKEN